LKKIETMNPTTQSSTTSTHPARQQRILRLPEVKAKTGFGRSTFYPSEHSSNPRMVLQTMHPIEGFIQQGSSDSWRQHVGRYCLDNPLLIVGVFIHW